MAVPKKYQEMKDFHKYTFNFSPTLLEGVRPGTVAAFTGGAQAAAVAGETVALPSPEDRFPPRRLLLLHGLLRAPPDPRRILR